MPPAAIVDAGFILAILDKDSSWHKACVAVFSAAPLPLATTEAVLTELFHLIAARNLNARDAWRFVQSGALTVRPMSDTDLPSIEALMAQYHDRPMDFADATLVRLAARESLSTLLTIDHDDFETYRIGRNKRFTILPRRMAR